MGKLPGGEFAETRRFPEIPGSRVRTFADIGDGMGKIAGGEVAKSEQF
jgi:hypothetical protein